jgi:hypothetical protein
MPGVNWPKASFCWSRDCAGGRAVFLPTRGNIALEGLLAAPMECLLDPGALRTRVSAELAQLAGIELDDMPTEEFFVAGLKTAVALARVNLTVTDGIDEFSWDAPVWFCDPWPHAFGLAGLEGFLHHFIVTIRAYDGYLDIEPQP